MKGFDPLLGLTWPRGFERSFIQVPYAPLLIGAFVEGVFGAFSCLSPKSLPSIVFRVAKVRQPMVQLCIFLG